MIVVKFKLQSRRNGECSSRSAGASCRTPASRGRPAARAAPDPDRRNVQVFFRSSCFSPTKLSAP
jgi:hypothetical protein